MNVKSDFLYGTIEEEVYVCQPPGFKDPDYPDKVYKVVKALYGLRQATRAYYETLTNYLLENGFQRGKIDQTLFIKRQKGDILLVQIYADDIIFMSTSKAEARWDIISQDKYVAKILRKFGLTDGKSVSTPLDTEKPLLKDSDGEVVDVHTYRSMIGSLMYLTSSRPDIMFVVCACARFQVTPKYSHLHAVNRIFRYLKGKPHLGLWYPKDRPFNLVAYSDSDYAGASLDRKSTTGRCQFLRCRLISWQCKKQTVVATSSTESEYVAVASCCLQVLWIQNQLLDYGIGYEKPSTRLTFYKAFFLPQWKFLIHTILKCMSAKRTSWNEFSSSMASAIICLSTGRKFNFSKYIFDSLVRNMDNSTKFYMYPRFLQLMIRGQVGDLFSHTTKYSSPALTQKVFANMRRVAKGFSRVDTPLFKGMIVAQQADDVADEGAAGVDVDADKIAQTLEITKLKQRLKKLERGNKLKVFELRRLKKVGTAQRVNISEDTVMDDVSKQGEIIANIDVDKDVSLKDVAAVEKTTEIEENANVTAASATITAATTLILVAAITAALSAARRRKGVVIRDPEETATPSIIIHFEPKSKDKGKGIMEKFNSNVDFLEKTKEQMEEEDSRALKRTMLNNDDGDVYNEATPLVLKVHVVDYAIHTENNKPYFKIIRADGTHQLFLSFLSLRRNFDREDLEVLCDKKKETKAFTFYRMETEEVSERYISPCFVSGLHTYDGEINMEYEKNMISKEFAVKLLLDYEEKDGEKVMKIELFQLDGVLLDKLKLYGEIKLEEEAATEEVIRGYKALREKNDLGVAVLPIRLEAQFDFHALANTSSNINVMPYRIYEKDFKGCVMPSGCHHDTCKILILDMPVDTYVPIVVGRSFLFTCGNILNTIKGTTSTFDGVCHQKFYEAKVKKAHEESDSNDEEDYCVKSDKTGKPIYGLKFAKYLNCNDPMDSSLALLESLNPFRKNCVWKKAVAFLGSLPVPLQHVEWISNYSDKFSKKGAYHHEAGSSRPKRTRKHETMKEAMLLQMKAMLEIKVYEMGGEEEIFSSEAWRRVFDINEPTYTELRHEFYSTYDFDEGLRSDENFNARDYWLSIISEEELHLSKSLASSIRSPILRHQNGYSNVAWLIVRWLKRKGFESQRDSMIYCGQFITWIMRRIGLLTEKEQPSRSTTPGAAIVTVDLGDNFTVKGHHLSMIKDRQFDEHARADLHKHIAEFVKICGMFRYGNTNAGAIKLKRFTSSLVGDAESVTTSLWEVPKTKKPTMPTEVTEEEDIKETTTNEHVNSVFTWSGLTYDSPVNPNSKTTIIHDDSEAEVDEAKKEVEPSSSKQTKSDPPPLTAYKPKIPYPQCLRKGKMEECYTKFIDLIKEVRINVPLVDVLAGMPNYGRFLKDLVSNKSKEQIFTAFLNEECSAIVQNKLPPKLDNPGSFLISCTIAGSVEYLALADLGASINLVPCSLYASLSENILKPTRMSIRLANHTYQYPMGITENMLVQQDVKPRLIHWILILQEFDIEIKNKKGVKNVAADHLSRLENLHLHELRYDDIDDNFPDENLMNISSIEKDKIPWFADFSNYLVGKILRKDLTYAQRCKFFLKLKHYFWDEPYVFKCPDGMIRRCVYGVELKRFLTNVIMALLGDIMVLPLHQRKFLIIQVNEIFDIWGVDFMGPFPKSDKFEYILFAINYVSEWAEAEALPTNDARVVINFLEKFFSRFGIPKALISDRGCNPDLKLAREKRFLQLHKLDELRLQAYANSKLYKARTKAYHDRNLRIQKEFNAGDKVFLYNLKYKFKAPKLISKWYGPFLVKHGFSSSYVKVYDKHEGSFIVNGYYVKLYHDEEKINELTTKEIHLMCEQGKRKAISFMASFLADYRETIPWVAEKPFIYNGKHFQ
nr:hypothetical protein [Tanacetum cinerariifolium]